MFSGDQSRDEKIAAAYKVIDGALDLAEASLALFTTDPEAADTLASIMDKWEIAKPLVLAAIAVLEQLNVIGMDDYRNRIDAIDEHLVEDDTALRHVLVIAGA